MLKQFRVITANGARIWHAEDWGHALEQHNDAFHGEEGETLIRIEQVSDEEVDDPA